jgi:hypothetical protein
MSDQCCHCTLRGNLAVCRQEECEIRGSWYILAALAEKDKDIARWIQIAGENQKSANMSATYADEKEQEIAELKAEVEHLRAALRPVQYAYAFTHKMGFKELFDNKDNLLGEQGNQKELWILHLWTSIKIAAEALKEEP